MYFRDMDIEHIMWEDRANKFSKNEIIAFLKKEKELNKLLKEVIATHKLIIKQAAQRLELSKYLEV